MPILIKTLGEYAVYLYAIAVVLAILLLRAAVVARRDRIQATFGMERETARNREFRVMGMALVLLLVVGAVYGVDRYVAPNIVIPDQPTTTPTLLFLPSITPTYAPATRTPRPTSPGAVVQPTAGTPGPASPAAGPSPTAAVTHTPAPPPAPPAACSNPGVRLTSPGAGQSISGVVAVAGTASIDRFQYYKLEMGVGANPGQWSFLSSNKNPVSGGSLGQWDTNPLPAGQYSLRLVVVDQTGNFPEPCKVVVNVSK
jgi:hypothetical protein